MEQQGRSGRPRAPRGASRTAAPAATGGVPPLRAGTACLPGALHTPPDSTAPPTSLRSLDETLGLLPLLGWPAAASFGGMPGVASAAAQSQKTRQSPNG